MTQWNAYTTFLVGGMLLTGTLNTLLVKLQDQQCVANCDDPDPTKRQLFEQPTWQTLNMFIGEFLCLCAMYAGILWRRFKSGELGRDDYEELPDDIVAEPDAPALPDVPAVVFAQQLQQCQRGRTNEPHGYEEGELASSMPSSTTLDERGMKPLHGWKSLLMWFPAFCDICGTTLMNVGLLYTTASVYQMLRGAVVIFSGLFSVIFLRHRLRVFQWFSLFLVMLGVGLVGFSNIITPPPPHKADGSTMDSVASDIPKASKSALGVTLVLLAQVFAATQFVFEELIMRSYYLKPIKAVGLEGMFGMLTVAAAIPVLHVAIGRAHPGGFFDAWSGLDQIVHTYGVWSTAVWVMLSIAFFNWFGLSVTRTVSATSRSTIDTCRTLFIWMVSLYLGWETFQWLQVIGFIILIYGTFVFNGVVRPPF